MGTANLTKAKAARAELGFADLEGACSRGADFGHVLFMATTMRHCDLRGANLRHASLYGANLAGSTVDSKLDAENVCLNDTILVDINLAPFCRADIEHEAQSFVDHRPIMRSVHATGLKEFLVGTGMPSVFAEYMVDCARSLDPSQVFSFGVLNELEETLEREARDGGNAYLIPVLLDDFVLTDWCPARPQLAQAVRSRVFADFRDHADGKTFAIQLQRLLGALKKTPAKTPGL
jgi:uncharacterized protein YjbI with pentapeptide repeats